MLRPTKAHSAGLVQQFQDRVNRLKQQVANDLDTRRDVDDVKATHNRIEDKLDQELEHHRRQSR